MSNPLLSPWQMNLKTAAAFLAVVLTCWSCAPDGVLVRELTLSDTALTLYQGETHPLGVAVFPADADNPSVEWSTTDADVATVSTVGVVTAVNAGVAIISAIARDGSGTRAQCVVTVCRTLDFNGHEYVDLALPSGVLWAVTNIGAQSDFEYGDCFAWGEPTGNGHGKENFNWATYRWCGGSAATLSRYCTDSAYGTVDGTTVVAATDDAAAVLWGGSWRMPTRNEWSELTDPSHCTWKWTKRNGALGYEVTSVHNGHTLFVPAAGYREHADLCQAGEQGCYWTATLNDRRPDTAWRFMFRSDNRSLDTYSRCYGLPIRPVARPYQGL